MLSKIDVRNLIKDHCRTLKNYRTQKHSIGDLLLFFIIPAVLGIVFSYRVSFSPELNSILITVYTIIIGLFLSVMILLFSSLNSIKHERTLLQEKKEKSQDEVADANWHLQLISELFCNLAFSVFLSLFTLVLLFINNVESKPEELIQLAKSLQEKTGYDVGFFVHIVFVSILWFCILQQALLILLILKRTHTLFRYEYDKVADIKL